MVGRWWSLSRKFLLAYLIFAHLASTTDTVQTLDIKFKVEIVCLRAALLHEQTDTAGISEYHCGVGCMIQCDKLIIKPGFCSFSPLVLNSITLLFSELCCHVVELFLSDHQFKCFQIVHRPRISHHD